MLLWKNVEKDIKNKIMQFVSLHFLMTFFIFRQNGISSFFLMVLKQVRHCGIVKFGQIRVEVIYCGDMPAHSAATIYYCHHPRTPFLLTRFSFLVGTFLFSKYLMDDVETIKINDTVLYLRSLAFGGLQRW